MACVLTAASLTFLPNGMAAYAGPLTAHLPSATYHIAAATVGDQVYVFGGLGASGPTSTIERLDTTDGTLHLLDTTLPTPTSGLSAVSDGTTIYLFGGSAAPKVILKFDPSSQSVTTLDATLPAGRWASGATLANRAIFLIGGFGDGGGWMRDIVKFDLDTRVASQVTDGLNLGGGGGAAFFDGTMVWYLDVGYSTIVKFNPVDGTATTLDHQASATGTGAAWMGDFAYIIGPRLTKFYPSNQTFVAMSGLSGLSNTGAAAAGSKVYTFGGSRLDGTAVSNAIWQFDPNGSPPPTATTPSTTAPTNSQTTSTSQPRPSISLSERYAPDDNDLPAGYSVLRQRQADNGCWNTWFSVSLGDTTGGRMETCAFDDSDSARAYFRGSGSSSGSTTSCPDADGIQCDASGKTAVGIYAGLTKFRVKNVVWQFRGGMSPSDLDELMTNLAMRVDPSMRPPIVGQSSTTTEEPPCSYPDDVRCKKSPAPPLVWLVLMVLLAAHRRGRPIEAGKRP